MCGIVGGIGDRDMTAILLEGLRRQEYRGYDSAGLMLINESAEMVRARQIGKVAELEKEVLQMDISGKLGIAHTRWATHGKPSVANAHPHRCNNVGIVHNGIIENYQRLGEQQKQQGYVFTSETDTEVIVHQIDFYLQQQHSFLDSVKNALKDLRGAYALGVVSPLHKDQLIAARQGSPLVIGVGFGEYFIASDVSALLPVTRQFIFLEEGDIADIRTDKLTIYDKSNQVVSRPIKESNLHIDSVLKGEYRHYMQKEIFEQPQAILNTLDGRISSDLTVIEESFGFNASEIFDRVKGIHIIACGTSYHAGMVAKYWMEAIAGLPCHVEVASEFRYRDPFIHEGYLFVLVSQSGETADTLAVLKEIKKHYPNKSLAICNVPESSLTREADLVALTHAGPEIGVASTKAFTTQLVVLMLLTLVIGRRYKVKKAQEQEIVGYLKQVPEQITQVLSLNSQIEILSKDFAEKNHALFLGRGIEYPIAMEGALKLKEISYIHAEAYPAGELKHGPLALVDAEMPVIAVAPNNKLLEKLQSNLQEVHSRGGVLYVFADKDADVLSEKESCKIFHVAKMNAITSPIVYVIPLQLLSYHVALIKGTDVDQPRNLAKSVTVE